MSVDVGGFGMLLNSVVSQFIVSFMLEWNFLPDIGIGQIKKTVCPSSADLNCSTKQGNRMVKIHDRPKMRKTCTKNKIEGSVGFSSVWCNTQVEDDCTEDTPHSPS
ncbi:hypothetical protein CKAN_00819800 [Cinnamomum micranthum f. kanehirae]|uniref:Uncharacterized protein n=1 Tax=Cinnamomum micranthum f. kanehirae TaxID=337451 RepID=A0A3S5WGI1_9MAGN|nr:hypothetical protein CKAN_00819800 [Cinnamomum micranthum f. kanehirae]